MYIKKANWGTFITWAAFLALTTGLGRYSRQRAFLLFFSLNLTKFFSNEPE